MPRAKVIGLSMSEVDLADLRQILAQKPELKKDASVARFIYDLGLATLRGEGGGSDAPSPAAATSEPVEANTVDVIREVLPAGGDVQSMLDSWECLNNKYWRDQLQPLWLTSSIEKYGKALGMFSASERVINVIPTEVRHPARLTAVLGHEMCHQAAHELYADLYGSAIGGMGDTSHRCVPWSRACFDVILADKLEVFVPVWRRSTGNRWFPWVPTINKEGEADWMVMERVTPDSTFMGLKLLSMQDAMHFEPGKYQPVD